MHMPRAIPFLLVFILSVLLTAAPAQAYIGPGSGLSAIGAFLAFLAGIVLAIFGFIWYPVKRLLRKRRKKAVEDAVEEDAQA